MRGPDWRGPRCFGEVALTMTDRAATPTPGPWTWERLVEDDGLPRVAEFTLKGPDVLCRYWHDSPPSADALTIAAASDLLAALNTAAGYLMNAKIDLETGAPKRTAINTIDGGLKVVRAAIAKATPDRGS